MGGYSETVAEAKPQAIIDQKGVQQALDDFGFNEDNAKQVVSEIMLDKRVKPDSRLRATDQVFKVHKSYGEMESQKQINIVIPIQVSQSFNIQKDEKEI